MKKLKEKVIEKKEYIILFFVALFIVIPFIGKNYVWDSFLKKKRILL